MARHHDDPDAAFNGWSNVWLDPAFRDRNIDPDAHASRARPSDPRADDPYGTLSQLDSIQARECRRVEQLAPAGTARTRGSPTR